MAGRISGGLETYNRFSHKGGIHDPREQLKVAGRDAYSIAHDLHLHGPPGSPIDIGGPKGQHPLASGEKDSYPYLTIRFSRWHGRYTNVRNLRAKHAQESEALENVIDELEQKLSMALPNEKEL